MQTLQALHLYYSSETIQKLERLAELTSYKKYTSFQHKLTVLDWCALILASIGEQAAQLPLDSAADMPAFLDGLDQAGLAITRVLDAYFQRSEGYDHVSTFLFEHVTYPFSEDYRTRRAQIAARGKAGLLAAITTRLAERQSPNVR